MNTIDNTVLYDSSQHYASNDSGLSSTSNSGETDQRQFSSIDYHGDDLTKSLFINSFHGNELIHDDDIYSYKSKVESKHVQFNRLLSFNLSKTDNIKTKNPNSLSNIFQDLANLKEPLKIPDLTGSTNYVNPESKLNDISKGYNSPAHFEEFLFEKSDQDSVKQRKSTKKQRPISNGTEYMSSSIKNYKGDKTINELVDFIQGKPIKADNNFKTDKVPISIKIEANGVAKCQNCITSDSGLYSEYSSPISVSIRSSNNVFEDSSAQSSHMVSLDNSDEDTVFLQPEFQEVKSKAKKKARKVVEDKPKDQLQRQPHYHSKKRGSDKQRNSYRNSVKTLNKSVNSARDLLDSKESIQRFLANQFSTFMEMMAS